MEEALIAVLLADAPLVALVEDRINWDVIPQGNVKPTVVMHLVTGTPDYHMTGPSGLVPSRVQVDCRGVTKAAALAVARAVESRLSGFSGTQGNIVFQGIFKEDARSGFEGEGADKVFRESADYRIWSGLAA
jgi:hypothetical protein